ncbi:class I SAM-dependent methyltransferase [Rhodococcus erythropolis]|uniref:class I SAM-dependent methyltransferase n=1 Tax=Rhodococcus erythropolis TaxID=1833 RepID=UPI00211A50D9|nr:class I SAM-dependent methyltransferase [Rhodococcus erythropolis]
MTGGVVNSGGVVVGREVDAVEMDAVEMNRLSWNAATVAHNSHKGDQAQFFRNGGSTLFPEEVALLGEIDGSSILHLQCNSGQDSLSLAALGAAVTGVDISDSAIDFARTLSAESGIAADFERADVSAWLRDAGATGRTFDRVFSSYGTVIWLPDLDEWAEGIAGVLAPNGRFVLVEFHPFAMCFDEKCSLTYPYGGGTPVTEPGGVGDYVADSADLVLPGAQGDGVENFENPFPSCEFTGPSPRCSAPCGVPD